MKKLIFAMMVICISPGLSAQYKKAGFFEKEGRTYELGAQYYMMGEGHDNVLGYKVSFGRDRDGRSMFKSWDIQFIPSHQYSYKTEDDMGMPVTVHGTSASTFVLGFNWGFHLLKNTPDELKRVQPFVGFGFNTLVLSGIKSETTDPETWNFRKRNTSEQTISVGFNGNLGCIFNINPTWAIKLAGGYSHQFNMSAQNWDDEAKPFFVFDSHKFASLGVRLRIVSE